MVRPWLYLPYRLLQACSGVGEAGGVGGASGVGGAAGVGGVGVGGAAVWVGLGGAAGVGGAAVWVGLGGAGMDDWCAWVGLLVCGLLMWVGLLLVQCPSPN